MPDLFRTERAGIKYGQEEEALGGERRTIFNDTIAHRTINPRYLRVAHRNPFSFPENYSEW